MLRMSPCWHLQVPTNKVKLVVGPGGETIKHIQKKSK
jgi:polyribonucleotide nucleotidyltransferase